MPKNEATEGLEAAMKTDDAAIAARVRQGPAEDTIHGAPERCPCSNAAHGHAPVASTVV
jgi:hypothetical protein